MSDQQESNEASAESRQESGLVPVADGQGDGSASAGGQGPASGDSVPSKPPAASESPVGLPAPDQPIAVNSDPASGAASPVVEARAGLNTQPSAPARPESRTIEVEAGVPAKTAGGPVQGSKDTGTEIEALQREIAKVKDRFQFYEGRLGSLTDKKEQTECQREIDDGRRRFGELLERLKRQSAAGSASAWAEVARAASDAYFHSGMGRSDEPGQANLLEDLPGRPTDLADYDVVDFDAQFNVFDDRRFVLISSWDDDVLLDVEYKIAARLQDRPNGVGQRKHLPSSQQSFKNGDPIEFEDILAWHFTSGASGSPLATFVDVRSKGLRESIDAFAGKVDLIKPQCRRLSETAGYIICVLYAECLDDSPTAALRKHRQDCPYSWHVEWLTPVLQHKAGAGADIAGLRRTLEEQWRRSLWPAAGEQAFCKQVRNYLAGPDGYGRLRQEVDDRERGPAEVKPDIDLSKADVVRRTVVFMGAYFPGLSNNACEMLAKRLLADVKFEREIVERVPNKKGNLRDRIVRKVEIAYEYWQSNRDDLLWECGLRRKPGQTRYDLDPRHGEHYREVFSSRLASFRHVQFERLNRCGLLYESEAPERMQQQLIDLASLLAQEEPEVYNADWLLLTVAAVERSAAVDETADDGLHEADQIRRLVAWLHEQGKENLFYPRFAQLCSKLFKSEATRPAVKDLLQRLIAAHASGIALRILRHLRMGMRSLTEFDSYYYERLRQILDVAPAAGRLEVMHYLVSEASRNPDQFEEICRHLRDWQPKGTEKGLSVSGRYALGFLFEYYKTSWQRFMRAFSAGGGARLEHPIFPAYLLECGREEDRNARIAWLVAWLLHPDLNQGLTLVLRDYLREDELLRILNADDANDWLGQAIDAIVVVADMIEGWNQQADLLSPAPRQACPEFADGSKSPAQQACSELLDRLLEAAADRKQVRKSLLQRWSEKACTYLDLLGLVTSKPEQEALKDSRRRVWNLRQAVIKQS